MAWAMVARQRPGLAKLPKPEKDRGPLRKGGCAGRQERRADPKEAAMIHRTLFGDVWHLVVAIMTGGAGGGASTDAGPGSNPDGGG
jgi:hypothetical protein